MNAEIVAVGTELLLGQIPNTNAQHISEELARNGIDVFFHTTVGDNLGRMTGTIETALRRSDAVVITGGLGPTPDDITREGVAAATGRPLVRDEALVETIRGIFERLGRRSMPESNLRQADLPQGAEAIAPVGTAPGFVLEHDGTLLFSLPGVPWEMRSMLEGAVLPRLREASGGGVIASREVHVIGLGESHVDERISDLVAAQSNPTIAYLAGEGRVRVRLTAKASTEGAARALIDPVEDEVRGRLGEDALGRGRSSVAEDLGALLRDRGATVAVAESLTGGLLGGELTRLPGASDFFSGGIVVYTDEVKQRVAGVDPALLRDKGAVSEEVAAALAESAARSFGADLGLSATGVAGPGEQDGLPPGTVFVGATFRGRTEVRRPRAYGDRGNVRAIAVTWAIDIGRRLLLRHGG
ncbi:MAG TPA: competence/damage-inducible protein A [Actinomycetota bacterium]|nr:competence/damage-inducible protein A [Actinomycetota bacterium]